MAEINWGALETPDIAGNALKYAQAGRQQAQVNAKQNALKTYATDPAAGISQLMAVDPEAAMQLQKGQQEQAQLQARKQAYGKATAGDYAGARTIAGNAGDAATLEAIGKMDDQQKAQAKDRAEALAAAAYSLRDVPYEQRKARLAQMTPELTQHGLTAEAIQSFDPSDVAIQGVMSQALGLKGLLEQGNKDRTYGLQEKQFGEIQRHNRVGESTAQAQVGVARGNLGVRQQEYKARKEAGGFGTPGVAGKVIGPDLDPNDGW
jgi:hypothetical protein